MPSRIIVIGVVLALLIGAGVLYYGRMLPAKVGVNNPASTVASPSETPATNSFYVKVPYIYAAGYYHVQWWDIKAADGLFSCVARVNTSPGEERITPKVVNGNQYCVSMVGDAAAGTSYETYKWTRAKYGKLITISFVLASGNCGNYDEPAATECRNSQNSLNLDQLVDGTFASIKPITSDSPTAYRNDQYGFEFSLPADWQGYMAMEGSWNADSYTGSGAYSGPDITFRNPNWTENEQWQDIPVMILAQSDWEALKQAKFHVGAAGCCSYDESRALGKNNKYVFTLYNRWIGFMDVKGMDEVRSWMQTNHLQAFNVSQ